MRYSLRLQTFQAMLNGVWMSDLPVVFTGDHAASMAYAAENGFVWKDSRKMLFGGYFFKPSRIEGERFIDCECLMPDVPSEDAERLKDRCERVLETSN